jgi:hypothetical protein
VLRYLPERANEAAQQLLDEAVIESETQREAVSVADAAVDARTDAWLEDRRRRARIEFGAGTDFEQLVRERYGRDFAAWRADTRRLVRVLLLRDRLVRLDQAREDGVDFRVLVLADEPSARAAVKALSEGADMTLYAQRLSLAKPAAPAPSARGEIPEKDLEERLFAAKDGDVLGPVPFETPEKRTAYQVFKVVRVWKADASPWSALASSIERSLETVAVSDEEVVRWRRRAFARHEVKGRTP